MLPLPFPFPIPRFLPSHLLHPSLPVLPLSHSSLPPSSFLLISPLSPSQFLPPIPLLLASLLPSALLPFFSIARSPILHFYLRELKDSSAWKCEDVNWLKRDRASFVHVISDLLFVLYIMLVFNFARFSFYFYRGTVGQLGANPRGYKFIPSKLPKLDLTADAEYVANLVKKKCQCTVANVQKCSLLLHNNIFLTGIIRYDQLK